MSQLTIEQELYFERCHSAEMERQREALQIEIALANLDRQDQFAQIIALEEREQCH